MHKNIKQNDCLNSQFGIEPHLTTILLEIWSDTLVFGQIWPNWLRMNRNVAFVVEKGKCLDCFSLESGVEIEVWLRCIMRCHQYFQNFHGCTWMKVKRIKNHIFGLNQMNHSLNTLKVSELENRDDQTDGFRAAPVEDQFGYQRTKMSNDEGSSMMPAPLHSWEKFCVGLQKICRPMWPSYVYPSAYDSSIVPLISFWDVPCLDSFGFDFLEPFWNCIFLIFWISCLRPSVFVGGLPK